MVQWLKIWVSALVILSSIPGGDVQFLSYFSFFF